MEMARGRNTEGLGILRGVINLLCEGCMAAILVGSDTYCHFILIALWNFMRVRLCGFVTFSHLFNIVPGTIAYLQ